MDKFYEIAEQYFKAYEGAHLYPKLWSWVWLLWLLAVVCMGHVLWQLLVHKYTPSSWVIGLALGLTGAASIAVQDHKDKALAGILDPSQNLQTARTQTLEKLTGVSANQFLHIAQDLSDLMQLRLQHGPQPLRWKDLLPIPWPKGQFLMHALTLAGIGIAAAGTFFPDLTAYVRSQISPESVVQALLMLMVGIIVALFVYPNMIYVMYNLKQSTRTWRARLQKNGRGNPVHLEYLLQHLIKFHSPSPTKQHALRHLKPCRPTSRLPKRTLR